MKQPPSWDDKRFSLRAKAIYNIYIQYGRVLSADELVSQLKEGRDAIQTAINELKAYNYIRVTRRQINGQYISHLKFVESQALETRTGNSGHLYIDSLQANSLSNSIDIDTNVSISIGAAPLEKKESEMAWPGFEEEVVTPKKNLRAKLDSDDDSGAVGKVVDKAALRRLKYKKTTFESTPRSAKRHDLPEEEWASPELVGEFYDLMREKATGAPNQVNGSDLGSWINKQKGSGTEYVSILKAIRMFFADPRNLHDVGTGPSLMHRFMAYYGTVWGIVTKDVKSKYEDDELLASQERMLKLLEG